MQNEWNEVLCGSLTHNTLPDGVRGYVERFVEFVVWRQNKAASPQPLHKIIVYFELLQSGKKKQNGYWRTEIFDFVLRRMQQQPDELLSQSRDNESLVATALVTPMCVSAISGKFRTGIWFFLLYRNEVSYKVKRKRNPHFCVFLQKFASLNVL